MSVVTSVPQPIFGPTGFIAPAEADILAGVIADWQLAFGGKLNVPSTPPTPGTVAPPQSQIIASETAIIGDAYALFCKLTNQFDPVLNSGRWQDGIGYIYFLTRIASAPTVTQVNCACGGNVTIPAGALISAADGNLYFCQETGTAPVGGGTIQLPFACNTNGPIACPRQTFQIYTVIPGWDAAVSPADGVLGIATETPAQFEARRAQSVAGNGTGSLPSILGAVLSVPGVLDCYAIENDLSTSVTVSDQTLVSHSVYVCVAGGAAAAVAEAIWTKKSTGCSYNGSTSVTVYDPNYSAPQPAYVVQFQIAAPTQALVAVTLKNSAGVPANALSLIQTAVQTAFNGADGGSRARIGSTIFATRYIPGIQALGPWAQAIVSLFVGSTTASAQSAVATGCTISGLNLTVTAVSSGTLAAGQTIFDSTGAVALGTQIISQTSGPAGGAGVYVVSISQTVAVPETITTAVANLNDFTMPIDQVPVLNNANIVLTLV